jgi:hypothetical protein
MLAVLDEVASGNRYAPRLYRSDSPRTKPLTVKVRYRGEGNAPAESSMHGEVHHDSASRRDRVRQRQQ